MEITLCNSKHFGIYACNQDNSVRIATDYGMDLGSIPSREKQIFFISDHTGSNAHPAPYPTGNGGSFD
jgi:hypothetical protein